MNYSVKRGGITGTFPDARELFMRMKSQLTLWTLRSNILLKVHPIWQ